MAGLNLNGFTVKLYQKLAASSNDNVFISPFSISTALSMCYVGAKENTATQMKQLLGFESFGNDQILNIYAELMKGLNAKSNSVELNVANRLYPMIGFDIKQDYKDAVSKHFHTDLHPLDFSKSNESAQAINKWVEEKTKNKIKDLIAASHLNSLTRLVLINAIYFKGNWQHQFDKAETYKEDFHLLDGSKTKVDMMRLNKKLSYTEGPADLHTMLLEVPYANSDVAMTILLPFENSDVNKLEASLTQEKLASVLQGGARRTVHFFLPKFKLEYSAELSDHLKALGAGDAFDQDKANFKGISDISSGLYISKVVHKAFVDVNEEGTEAAAATGVIMMTRSAMPMDPPVEFKCDRPFLFIIHDKSNGSVLFMGKYLKP